jgi:hypothetical protein
MIGFLITYVVVVFLALLLSPGFLFEVSVGPAWTAHLIHALLIAAIAVVSQMTIGSMFKAKSNSNNPTS